MGAGRGVVERHDRPTTARGRRDVEAGLGQLTRVARQRIAIVTMDVPTLAKLWIIEDYLPEFVASTPAAFRRSIGSVSGSRTRPRKCSPCHATARTASYQRSGRDHTHSLTPPSAQPRRPGTTFLQRRSTKRSLACGTTFTRCLARAYGHLLEQAELDVGLRIITSKIAV